MLYSNLSQIDEPCISDMYHRQSENTEDKLAQYQAADRRNKVKSRLLKIKVLDKDLDKDLKNNMFPHTGQQHIQYKLYSLRTVCSFINSQKHFMSHMLVVKLHYSSRHKRLQVNEEVCVQGHSV